MSMTIVMKWHLVNIDTLSANLSILMDFECNIYFNFVLKMSHFSMTPLDQNVEVKV